MAHFYGRLKGNRGETTRCGSRNSGIRATIRSWRSEVFGHLYDDRQNCGDVLLLHIDSTSRDLLSLRLYVELIGKHRDDPGVEALLQELEAVVGALNEAAIQADKE